jgi:hypothetical protein
MEAGCAQIEFIDERVDEPNRAVRRHIIVDRRRQQQRLVACMTFNVRHRHSIRLSATRWNQSPSFRTVCAPIRDEGSSSPGLSLHPAWSIKALWTTIFRISAPVHPCATI